MREKLFAVWLKRRWESDPVGSRDWNGFGSGIRRNSLALIRSGRNSGESYYNKGRQIRSCITLICFLTVSVTACADPLPRAEMPDPFLDIWDHAVAAMDRIYGDWKRNDDRSVESTEYTIEYLSSIYPESRRRLDAALLMQADQNRDKFVSRDESKRFLELQLGIRWETNDLLRHNDGRVVDFKTFLLMDVNRDSRLSGNEFRRAKAMLGPLDQDGDEIVSLAEFSNTEGPFLKDPIEAFRSADRNSDQGLDLAELAESVSKSRAHLVSPNLAAFDQDDDQRLSLTEYRVSMLGNFNYPWHVIPSDQNRDRRMSFKEFRFADRGLFHLQRRFYFHRLDADRDGELTPNEFPFETSEPNALYVVSLSGSDRKQIYRDEDYPVCGSPDVSPDGRSLIFDAKANEQSNQSVIRLITIDGQDARDLCDGAMPTWSARGDRFACSRGVGVASIWIMRLDGSEDKRIDEGWGAQWSPDGKSIAYATDNSMRIYDVESGESRPLLQKGSHPYRYIHANMAWSPDSQSLVFKGKLNDEEHEVAIVNVEAGKLTRRFRSSDQMGGDFAWSSDGKEILFPLKSSDQPRSLIYRMPAESLQPPMIDKLVGDSQSWKSVCFSRDGRSMVLATASEL